MSRARFIHRLFAQRSSALFAGDGDPLTMEKIMSRARWPHCSFALFFSVFLVMGCGDATSTNPGPDCGPADIDGLAVSTTDPLGGTPYALGYPPHALDACQLAYLAQPAAGEDAGPLVLRDLATKTETIIATAFERPRRPSLAGDVLAWEAELDGVAVVRVRTGGVTVTLTGPFQHAGEPRASADGVVFTAFLTADDLGDSDIYVAKPGESAATAVHAAPGQQRFADISEEHIAFCDFSEDPDGRFDQNATDLADVVIVDRESGESQVRERPGKQAFPLLGAGGKVAYLDWDGEHPEPKFSAYRLLIGNVAAPAEDDALAATIATQQPYIRPAARGERLSWVTWQAGGDPSLWTRPADLSVEAEQVSEIAGPALLAPAESSNLTLVIVVDGGVATLRAVEH